MTQKRTRAMAKPSFECDCAQCQSACRNKPGWFLPGEVEALAQNLAIPVEQLFRERLAVDWWATDAKLAETFVLSPAVVENPAGQEFPSNPRGICTFFKNGKCEIHEYGKPHECAALTHESAAKHVETARAWQSHRQSIRDLLGRDPIADRTGFSFFDLLELFR